MFKMHLSKFPTAIKRDALSLNLEPASSKKELCTISAFSASTIKGEMDVIPSALVCSLISHSNASVFFKARCTSSLRRCKTYWCKRDPGFFKEDVLRWYVSSLSAIFAQIPVCIKKYVGVFDTNDTSSHKCT